MNRSPLGAFLLILFVFACFALSPQARAVCQEGCLTNDNTVLGDDALVSLTTGVNNTAIGSNALYANTTAHENTAVGYYALADNTTGGSNVAIGLGALRLNTTGGLNTAVGYLALNENTIGVENVAIGHGALEGNTAGNLNVAIGPGAGLGITTGSQNIAIGWNAGSNTSSESNNIIIGSRIGFQLRKAFISGIKNSAVTGTAVVVAPDGQLGVAPSSARFKDAIKPMDKASEAILALKPVTFQYTKELDPNGIPQFGLVAEEVEKVNPDLVARDDQGKPYTVRYEAVNAMLLNEFLKEHAKVEQLKKEFESKIAEQQKQIEALTAGLQKVSAELEFSKTASQIVLNNQ
jgi:trimeric autotransporter adhesin